MPEKRAKAPKSRRSAAGNKIRRSLSGAKGSSKSAVPRRVLTRARPVMGGPLMPNPGSLLVGLGRAVASRQLGFGNARSTTSARSRAAAEARMNERVRGYVNRGGAQTPQPRGYRPPSASANARRTATQMGRSVRRGIERGGSAGNPQKGAYAAVGPSMVSGVSRRKPRPPRRGGSARTM